MVTRSEFFKENLKRWALFSPEAAKIIEATEIKTVQLVANESTNEHNLVKIFNGERVYLHSEDDVTGEAHAWAESLNLRSNDILFVYGVGLAYYLCYLNIWMNQNPRAFIIFLEDDPEVIRVFFETVNASSLLNTPKARLFYIGEGVDEAKIIDHLSTLAVMCNPQVSALNSYKKIKGEKFHELQAKLIYSCNRKATLVTEYMNYSLSFLRNFYENMLDLPHSKLGSGLFGQFEGMPAIVCGAGPSLEKNREVLKNLGNRALILAGGTAINALNAFEMQPHFGVGVDPNPFQFTRYIANQSYELPFFYRSRLNHEAFEIIHGEKIYVTGAGGYLIADWFEKKLGIESTSVDEGHNVVNMSVALAHSLGCSPIILVGVDLAYSNNKSYAPDIKNHAIHEFRSEFFTKTHDEELLTKRDINGDPIYTLWKWIDESVWFGYFNAMHPECRMINSTEGGLGFPKVANIPLKDVADQFLTKEIDFGSLIHGLIQNSPLPEKATFETIVSLLTELKNSLKKCSKLYDKVIFCWNDHEVKILAGESFASDHVPEKVVKLLEEIEKEEAFQALLKVFEMTYLAVFRVKYEELSFHPAFSKEQDIALKKADFSKQIYGFIKTACDLNAILIDEVIQTSTSVKEVKEKTETSPEMKRLIDSFKLQDGFQYSYENGLLILKDKEFDLDIEEKIELEKKVWKSSDKKLEEESYYLGNKLHGPSVFKGMDGKILATTFYIHGKKAGKSFAYYPNQQLASLQRYRDGLPDGRQEYYAENGNLKSVINYRLGRLHGEVLLFHPNGRKARELYFQEGKREGLERMWNPFGAQLIEAHYENDSPAGTAREWYPNGNIKKELVYDPETGKPEVRQWDRQGVPQQKEEGVKVDYFDSMTKQTTALTSSLEKVYEEISRVIPAIHEQQAKKKEPISLDSDFERLQGEIEHLRLLNETLLQETSGEDTKNAAEAIWKTPTVRREMEKQIGDMTKKMQEDLRSMQEALHIALGLLAKNAAFKPPEQIQDEPKK